MIYGAEGAISLVNILVFIGIFSVIAAILLFVSYNYSFKFKQQVINNRLLYGILLLPIFILAVTTVIVTVYILVKIYFNSDESKITIASTNLNFNAQEVEKRLLKQRDINFMKLIAIKLGERGDSFKDRYPDLVKINQQPAGLNFYKIDWDSRPHGTIKLEHGSNSFELDHVLGITGTQDAELPSEGMYTIDVNVGLSDAPPGLISHDEARLKTYGLLKRIEQTGWKIMTPRGDPRLSGKDRLNYVLTVDEFLGLDTRYTPTLEEWMRIQSRTSWSFYADRLYMKVSFTRERTLTDPTKPGSYLLSFDIRSEAEEYRAYVGPDNRARWKELLPAELAPRDAERAKKETELRAKGIKIDETYQDPPIPVLK
jgi:uncharacterized membrane protein